LPSVTLSHVCGTNSHNRWAKGLPGVGVVKIFNDSDSSGWKSFRLRLLDSDSAALGYTKLAQHTIGKGVVQVARTVLKQWRGQVIS